MPTPCLRRLPFDGRDQGKTIGPWALDKLSIVETIEQVRVAPGASSGTYAFVRTTIQRNLYRIPLP